MTIMTPSDVQIAAIQFSIAWQNPQQNMIQAEELLSQIEVADICLLPEMWTTGFVTQPSTIPSSNKEALPWMQHMASQYGMVLCGTVAERLEEGYKEYFVNRMYFVEPSGKTTVYDKRHLFTMGGEDKSFTPGCQRVIVDYKGMRFLLLTCYDLRFPVWIRNRNDYDSILIAANWPQPRRTPWDILLQARAIENQCFVVASNRVGDDMGAHYNGGTVIIDPKGKVLASAEDDVQQVISAKLSIEERERFLSKFNVLRDADNFILG